MVNKFKDRLLNYFFPYLNVSYSQEGEDLILRRFFSDKEKGFYIDVGAHHPYRFSNTMLFYNKGWHGINIDAMPGSMQVFNKKRPRDINIEAAISDSKTLLTYFMFNEPALNGFDKKLSINRAESHKEYFIVDEVNIETKSLTELLDNVNDTAKNNIDFLTVDVEGLDFQVLKSNDWLKYRPKLILVEILNFDNLINDDIATYLFAQGYVFYAKAYYTVFFIDTKESN